MIQSRVAVRAQFGFGRDRVFQLAKNFIRKTFPLTGGNFVALSLLAKAINKFGLLLAVKPQNLPLIISNNHTTDVLRAPLEDVYI